MPAERCELCGKTKEDHTGMAHRFSTTGELEVEEPPKPTPRVLAVDPVVRMVLIDKGLATAEDFKLKEAELIVQFREALPDTADPNNPQ